MIRVEQPGEQPIYFEQRGAAQASAPADLKVTITPAAGDEPLALGSSFGNVTYNTGDVAGRNFGTVTFPAAGDYKVEAASATGGGQIALGGNPGEKLVGSLLGFFGLGFGSFIACVIIMIVVAVKRARNRRLVMQQYHSHYPPPGGMPPPPPGAQA